ncbi:transcriptional regulator [Actinokineospora fastidiosa]|uniref:Transcriptional regulator n=1 Tax=Actinokineospora fastidiosa TaxID=1816 RepID=A0A918GF36_9PSEU|nr:transcriptional regulator [Actinokineospora fastidiosa]
MQLDVHHLRVLRAIADTGSLSRAAVRLGITQPAVHAQLNRLEKMLGYQLFERRQDGVTATPIGELLLRRITAVLPQMDQLLEDIKQRTCSTRPPATTRIAAVCSTVVPRLPAAMTTVWPEISEVAVVNDESSDRLVSLLDEYRVEIAMIKDYPGRELPVPAAVDTAVVVTEPTFVLLPEGHRLAEKEMLTLDDLDGQPLVMGARSSSAPFREYFIESCADFGFVPTIAHQVNSQAVAQMIVRAGAVGLAQPACLDVHPGIEVRPLTGDVLMRRHVLAWRRNTFVAERSGELHAEVTAAYWQEAYKSPEYRRYLAARN